MPKKLPTHPTKFPTQALDMRVNGAVNHIDFVRIGRIHQLIPRFHVVWMVNQDLH